MFYKIRNDILFRQYKGYGFITDNSEFGYHYLNDTRRYPGETFVSESGSVMLAALRKEPRNIDDIINELLKVFIGVEYETLLEDTKTFFGWLIEQGYLSGGETFSECMNQEYSEPEVKLSKGNDISIAMEDGEKDLISPNDFLRSIHFDITSICNERCVHCYIPHKNKTQAIDPDLFYRIVEDGRNMNIIHVTLSGGEPLLHDDFVDFLIKCRELDLSVNVLTNLTLLTDEMVLEMKKNPLLSVQTSLYSMDPHIHDSITRVKGSFEKTKRGLLQLYSAGIPLQISCPVIKQNKDSFLDVILWGQEHNIAVAVEPVIFAAYDHSGSNLENRLSLEELESTLEKQLPEGYADIMNEVAKEKEQLRENNPICSVCRYSFCVSAEGNVFPCAGWQTNTLGNLNEQSVQDIWENSEKIKALRQIKRKDFPKCITCEDRGYCTVCMMSNANENQDGDVFDINEYHCKAAAITHRKVDDFIRKTQALKE